MLVSSGVLKVLWEKAIITATYIVNRTPSSVLSEKTLEQVWTDNLQINTLLELLDNCKLEPRSQKCVFLGYPDGVKWYRLWTRSI